MPQATDTALILDYVIIQYQRIVEVDGIKVQLELLDTAGTEQVSHLYRTSVSFVQNRS